jgi:CBS domain-containing protein
MALVRDVLARKGAQVFSVSPEATVLEAARLMNDQKIGCLVVMDGQRVDGIFTERDVLSRVVAEGRDATVACVRDVMTRAIVCCRPETDLAEARSVFKNRRIRHMPVVDGSQKLLGLVSIGDLNAFDADAKEQTIHLLHEYIYGRT